MRAGASPAGTIVIWMRVPAGLAPAILVLSRDAILVLSRDAILILSRDAILILS